MADGAGDKAELEVAVDDHEAKVALWVASAVARASILVLPPALAARAAVLAFGDELLDVQLPNRNDQWLAPGGRDLAAAYLLQRAETALRQELQRLADAAKRARLALSAVHAAATAKAALAAALAAARVAAAAAKTAETAATAAATAATAAGAEPGGFWPLNKAGMVPPIFPEFALNPARKDGRPDGLLLPDKFTRAEAEFLYLERMSDDVWHALNPVTVMVPFNPPLRVEVVTWETLMPFVKRTWTTAPAQAPLHPEPPYVPCVPDMIPVSETVLLGLEQSQHGKLVKSKNCDGLEICDRRQVVEMVESAKAEKLIEARLLPLSLLEKQRWEVFGP